MPWGLDDDALCFLCFDWAALASVTARGATYFFGGMAAGWRGEGGEWREKGKWRETEGEKRGIGGKRAFSRRQSGPTRLFAWLAPPGDPGGLGFGSGSPAIILAQTGDKLDPVGATGPIFGRRR